MTLNFLSIPRTNYSRFSQCQCTKRGLEYSTSFFKFTFLKGMGIIHSFMFDAWPQNEKDDSFCSLLRNEFFLIYCIVAIDLLKHYSDLACCNVSLVFTITFSYLVLYCMCRAKPEIQGLITSPPFSTYWGKALPFVFASKVAISINLSWTIFGSAFCCLLRLVHWHLQLVKLQLMEMVAMKTNHLKKVSSIWNK